MTKPASVSSIAILGGSFNPLHFGHLRLGIEVYEALAPSRVDFMPCANPAHKAADTLLPFEMRYKMLVDAVSWHPQFYVNRLEAEREGLSYTSESLREYKRALPESKLFFVLGAEDFERLETWREWQILPELAEFVVVGRKGIEKNSFNEKLKILWPQSQRVDSPHGYLSFGVGRGGLVSYLDVPRLDIDASLIRHRWLAGRSIDYWVPRAVIEVLRANNALVKQHWTF